MKWLNGIRAAAVLPGVKPLLVVVILAVAAFVGVTAEDLCRAGKPFGLSSSNPLPPPSSILPQPGQ